MTGIYARMAKFWFPRAYFSTLRAMFLHREELLSDADSVHSARSHMDPALFLVTSIALAVIANAAFGVGFATFELPPALPIMPGISAAVPWIAILMVCAAAYFCTTLLTWMFLVALSRRSLKPTILFRHYTLFFGTSFFAIALMIVVLSLRAEYFGQTTLGLIPKSFWWIEVPFVLFSFYYIVVQLSCEFKIAHWKVFVAVVLANSALAPVLPPADAWLPIATFSIASGSGEPTLLPGDVILVNKWAYSWRMPRRGEIVVFKRPDGAVWVKRLIGLPGDTVAMINGDVAVNGQILRRVQGDAYRPSVAADREPPRIDYTEYLPNGRHYRVLYTTGSNFYDEARNFAQYAIPPGQFFVIGDNRDNSMDSRFGERFGPVTSAELIGPAYWRISPRPAEGNRQLSAE